MDKIWWIIKIGGYGQYAFYGTKTEAEVERTNKSDWEGGGGRKSRAVVSNPKHQELVQLAILSHDRKRERGGSVEELPPLIESKPLTLQNGMKSFKNIKNIKNNSPLKIEILGEGKFLIEIKEKDKVVEQHFFSSFERASNYISIYSLI